MQYTVGRHCDELFRDDVQITFIKQIRYLQYALERVQFCKEECERSVSAALAEHGGNEFEVKNFCAEGYSTDWVRCREKRKNQTDARPISLCWHKHSSHADN